MSISSSDTESSSNHTDSTLQASPTSKLAPRLSFERWTRRMRSPNGHVWRFVGLSVVVIACLLSLVVLMLKRDAIRPNANLCLTTDCITAASDLLKSMDRTVDPCDDFFDYACGGWTQFNTIDEDESRTDTFTVMRNDLTDKIRIILETPVADNETNTTKKAKILYKSCIDEDLIEQRGGRPLQSLLDDLGGWPLLKHQHNQHQQQHQSGSQIKHNLSSTNDWV
ncbi:unnamed protein product, partial [Medioppia subpectinata]